MSAIRSLSGGKQTLRLEPRDLILTRSAYDHKRVRPLKPIVGVVKSLGYYRRGPVGLVHTQKIEAQSEKPTWTKALEFTQFACPCGTDPRLLSGEQRTLHFKLVTSVDGPTTDIGLDKHLWSIACQFLARPPQQNRRLMPSIAISLSFVVHVSPAFTGSARVNVPVDTISPAASGRLSESPPRSSTTS